MRRFVIAIVLLVAAISISIGAQVIFLKNTDALISSMNDLLKVIDTGDAEKVKQELDTVMHNWEHSKKILHIILIHTAMDEIEMKINSLSELLKSDDMDSFRQSCTEALRQLENLQGASKLTAENIF